MSRLTAVIVGAGRMGGTIDDEMGDYPRFVLPYSHAAGYAAIPEVELVAFADTDEAKCEALQARHGVPRGYRDYREMIETEKPDIVSVTTPGTTHAEITIFAAEHGARGIYCEKAFACSLEEADAMVEAVERNGVKFNMGTLRRWNAGTNTAMELIRRGRIGSVQAVVTWSVGSLLHSASHFIDLLSYFADDAPVEWVQGTVLNPDFDPTAERSEVDLNAVGIVRFANGVWGHLLSTSRWAQFEVICSEGVLRTRNDCDDWQLLVGEKGRRHSEWSDEPFPEYARESSTARLIRDLVQAIETDGETSQGVRAAAASAEIAFGLVQSHRQGGARVDIPAADRGYWMFTH